MAQREVRTHITQDMVLLEMSLLSHSRINHYIVDEEGQVNPAEGAPEGALAAIQSVRRRKTTRTDKDGCTITTLDVEIRLWPKVEPLRLVGRHVGLFSERMEHSGPNGRPIDTVSRIERVIIELPAGTLAVAPSTEGTNPARDEHLLKG